MILRLVIIFLLLATSNCLAEDGSPSPLEQRGLGHWRASLDHLSNSISTPRLSSPRVLRDLERVCTLCGSKRKVRPRSCRESV